MREVYLYEFAKIIDGREYRGTIPACFRENAEWAVRCFGGTVIGEIGKIEGESDATIRLPLS